MDITIYPKVLKKLWGDYMVPPTREIAATMTATAIPVPQKITMVTKLGKHLSTVLILVTDYNAVSLASIAAWYMRATLQSPVALC